MKTKHKMTFAIETITPDQASKILESNYSNQRNVVMGHVRFLSDQMKSGQWIASGQPIIFDDKNQMLDGQHRMHAIILSGAPCEMAVVRGVSGDSFKVIDTGRPRTKGNIFAIAGIADYNGASATAHLIWKYDRAISSGGSINMSFTKPSAEDLIEIYESDKGAFIAGLKYGKRLSGTGICQSIGAACYVLAIRQGHDQALVDWFFERLIDGANLTEGSSIRIVRNMASKNMASKAKLPSWVLFAVLVKAFNLYARSKETKAIIHQAGEKFPELLK